MRVVIGAGNGVGSILSVVKRRFKTGNVEIEGTSTLSNIEKFLDSGMVFDRMIILEPCWLQGEENISTADVREFILYFLNKIVPRNAESTTYVFVTTEQSSAQVISEETLGLVNKVTVLLRNKGDKYTANFFSSILTAEIMDMPSDLVYKPQSVSVKNPIKHTAKHTGLSETLQEADELQGIKITKQTENTGVDFDELFGVTPELAINEPEPPKPVGLDESTGEILETEPEEETRAILETEPEEVENIQEEIEQDLVEGLGELTVGEETAEKAGGLGLDLDILFDVVDDTEESTEETVETNPKEVENIQEEIEQDTVEESEELTVEEETREILETEPEEVEQDTFEELGGLTVEEEPEHPAEEANDYPVIEEEHNETLEVYQGGYASEPTTEVSILDLAAFPTVESNEHQGEEQVLEYSGVFGSNLNETESADELSIQEVIPENSPILDEIKEVYKNGYEMSAYATEETEATGQELEGVDNASVDVYKGGYNDLEAEDTGNIQQPIDSDTDSTGVYSGIMDSVQEATTDEEVEGNVQDIIQTEQEMGTPVEPQSESTEELGLADMFSIQEEEEPVTEVVPVQEEQNLYDVVTPMFEEDTQAEEIHIEPVQKKKGLFGGLFRKRKSSASVEGLLRELLESYRGRAVSIVVTGTKGSGKSTVASNLADVVSRLGYNVLLVDMDIQNRTQGCISKRAYDAVHTIGSDNYSLKQALNTSRRELGRYVSVVGAGFHLLTLGLAANIDEYKDLAPKERLLRFSSMVRSSYSVVIYDLPFDIVGGYASDLVMTSDYIVLTTEYTNYAATDLMLKMSNLGDSREVENVMFNRTQLCFNKVQHHKSRTILGKVVNTPKDYLKAIDTQIVRLLGILPDYALEELEVCGELSFADKCDFGWYGTGQITNSAEGWNEYTALLHKILLRKGDE